MESEERECREYEADLINGTGERETIDQGKDEIEGKDWNEGIRTMALMEFMKLTGPRPKQMIEGADLSDDIDGTYESKGRHQKLLTGFFRYFQLETRKEC